MSDDFERAGEVVEEFITIGNVARAMVLRGMKEYARQVFGDEALELFGDEEFGGSSGGSSKPSKSKLQWDSSKKGTDVQINENTIKTGSVSALWNGIYGTPKFEKGLHYVEIQTIQMSSSHFIFYGVSDNSLSSFDSCCAYGTATTCGYSGAPKWKENDYTGFILDNRTSTVRIQFFVNGVGSGWTNTQYNDNTTIVLFVCMASNIELKITNYSQGEKAIKEYIKKQHSQTIDI